MNKKILIGIIVLAFALIGSMTYSQKQSFTVAKEHICHVESQIDWKDVELETKHLNGTKKIERVSFLKNVTVCSEIEKYNISVGTGMINLDLKENWVCKYNNKELVCDSVYDGNGDGKCSSGESCIIYSVENLKLIKSEDANFFIRTKLPLPVEKMVK